ncbi:uncharacterized protein C8R40DRAFT_990061, partial [Lentinula edodes]|uniref:uncharacterized protein n=1 Tax=Lentinula edodes TaxID=5353 RepID=UPI001E8DFD7A
LGILALQETHLTDEQVDEITQHYDKKIQIFAFHDPINPTCRGGVAIVLNQRLLLADTPKVYEIIPRHALLLQVMIKKKDNLAVYAPNVSGSTGSDTAQCWKDIKTYFDTRPTAPKPNIMLGNHNMV